jgi:ZIP family zinc transporter
MDPIVFIVIIAFLGPIIGSMIGVIRKPSFTYVCCMLCFAAGVMLAISFMELIPESIRLSSVPLGVLGLVFGSLVMYGLDRLLCPISIPVSAARNTAATCNVLPCI